MADIVASDLKIPAIMVSGCLINPDQKMRINRLMNLTIKIYEWAEVADSTLKDSHLIICS